MSSLFIDGEQKTETVTSYSAEHTKTKNQQLVNGGQFTHITIERFFEGKADVEPGLFSV